jgi:large subunit ribosomal protein L6
MSRIGKKPISLPEGVSFVVAKDGEIKVKGPKGELTCKVDSDFEFKLEEGVLEVLRPTEQKRHKALHGLYRSLVSNMIEGVNTGYTISLELVGVGFKAVSTNNVLELSLGYSHNIFFQLPEEVVGTAIMEKGKNPKVVLESIDKQLIGHIAAKLRSLRKVEPYKGKGVRFVGEQVRRKAGKTAAK